MQELEGSKKHVVDINLDDFVSNSGYMNGEFIERRGFEYFRIKIEGKTYSFTPEEVGKFLDFAKEICESKNV